MSPNTEWDYRRALEQAGVLGGDPNELPSLTELQRLVARYRPNKPVPQQLSTVARDEPLIEHMLQAGAQPQAIYDLLRTRDPAFCGSLSAIKRSSISSTRPSSLRDATPSRRAMASSYH